MSWQSGMPMRE